MKLTRKPIVVAVVSLTALLAIVALRPQSRAAAAEGTSDPLATTAVIDPMSYMPEILAESERFPRQKSGLANGVVTEADYVRAVRSSEACIRDHGLNVVTELQANGLFYETRVTGDSEHQSTDVTPVVRSCQQANLDLIEQAWSVVNSAHSDAERQAYEAAYKRCARGRNLTLDPKSADRCAGTALRSMKSSRPGES